MCLLSNYYKKQEFKLYLYLYQFINYTFWLLIFFISKKENTYPNMNPY
jgi:hypothetical protein